MKPQFFAVPYNLYGRYYIGIWIYMVTLDARTTTLSYRYSDIRMSKKGYLRISKVHFITINLFHSLTIAFKYG